MRVRDGGRVHVHVRDGGRVRVRACACVGVCGRGALGVGGRVRGGTGTPSSAAGSAATCRPAAARPSQRGRSMASPAASAPRGSRSTATRSRRPCAPIRPRHCGEWHARAEGTPHAIRETPIGLNARALRGGAHRQHHADDLKHKHRDHQRLQRRVAVAHNLVHTRAHVRLRSRTPLHCRERGYDVQE
jgi:hypothetical protein